MTDPKPHCADCRTPLVPRNGIRACVLCDRIDLMPAPTPPFRQPGE